MKEVFSEEKKKGGEYTAWMEKDITRKVKREMSCLADWERQLGGVLGQHYAWRRGHDDVRCSRDVCDRNRLYVVMIDRIVLAKYKAAQSLKSAELKSTLSQEKPLDSSHEKVQEGSRP